MIHDKHVITTSGDNFKSGTKQMLETVPFPLRVNIYFCIYWNGSMVIGRYMDKYRNPTEE